MTSETIEVRVNGKAIRVSPNTIVAAAVALAGLAGFRRSVLSQPRGPLCGMGICMECRVAINGQTQCRSCQTLCEQGMEIRTDP
jgi:predicted molibdopterin-dependent oxidoreductase YjgC